MLAKRSDTGVAAFASWNSRRSSRGWQPTLWVWLENRSSKSNLNEVALPAATTGARLQGPDAPRFALGGHIVFCRPPDYSKRFFGSVRAVDFVPRYLFADKRAKAFSEPAVE